MQHLYLFGYDIHSRKRRNRVHKLLVGHALDGQESAYECWLAAHEFRAARQALAGMLDEADRLLITRLDPRASIHVLGKATRPTLPNLFYAG